MDELHQLQPGLWHWQAPHPDWTPSARWPQHVSSSAIDTGTHLILIDPVGVPQQLLTLAAQRQPAILLTAPWHERDTQQLVQQLDALVYTPRPDTAQDLVDKFGVTLERAGDGSPDLRWLLTPDETNEHRHRAHLYAAGDQLPIGPLNIEVFPGREFNDVILWIDPLGALIPGDTLVDFGEGFEVNRWLRGGITRPQVIDLLRPLLDLPIQTILPAHGTPTDRTTLQRILT